jgi:L-threonylcarbamoyladenylate synthase
LNAQRLADRFWPGALTLVVKKSPRIPDEVTAGLDTVGVRMPAHAIARELIKRAGFPIAAPSANRFMQISPTTAEHVRAGLGNCVEMILDGGVTDVGIESTVLSVAQELPVLLRPGMIGRAVIESVVGPVISGEEVRTGSAHPSPGLHHRHYAPRTPLFLITEGNAPPAGRGKILSMPSAPEEFAASLYSTLHQADAEGWEWIGVPAPPRTPEWTAIWDRLLRASTRG